jgi:hypothetical protein
MKIVLDFGASGIYSVITPPYLLIIVAMILAALIVAKWHYNLRYREIQSKELEGINRDNRETKAHRGNSESAAGGRQERACRGYVADSLHRQVSDDLQRPNLQ